ncbi:hypothetical protein Ahy_A03g010419 isoform B [Arachis hypogaea]|uniref:Uncharacterized protein n=1 Tax=Arachis hypogaea TaxID=3818 RepID=A0A445DM16_ARAHY|nr:hypothetical protein Ahy_A03g010419 isoform B [Arachis hypogaea]
MNEFQGEEFDVRILCSRHDGRDFHSPEFVHLPFIHSNIQPKEKTNAVELVGVRILWDPTNHYMDWDRVVTDKILHTACAVCLV